MDRIDPQAAVSVAVVVVLLLGVLFITTPGSAFTTVGVVLVIVGLMGLMPVVRLGLADDPADVIGFL